MEQIGADEGVGQVAYWRREAIRAKAERVAFQVAHQQAIEGYQQQIVQSKQIIAELNEELANKDRFIQNIYNSRSWRVSAPIRIPAKIIRKMHRN